MVPWGSSQCDKSSPMPGENRPCHWGVVNGGCDFVGRPHISHSFTTPHPMVYETSQATQNIFSDRWNFSRWKINVCKMKRLVVHPVVREHLCGILKVPKGFPKFPMELMVSALGSTFRKEEVGVRFPRLASSLPQVLLVKDWVWKYSS